MRKLAIAALSLPVLAFVYATALFRRSIAARVAIVFALATVVGVGVIASVGSAPTTARPPSVPVPLTSAAFRTAVTTGVALDAPVAIEFSTPMDAASVAAAIAVDPPTSIELDWDASGRNLTILPGRAWAPDTYHRISVEGGALARTGRPLVRSVGAVFLTRSATGGAIAATDQPGRRVALTSGFVITFERPVEVGSLAGAVTIEPPLDGRLEATGGLAAGTHFSFIPAEPLAPDTRYRVRVAGVHTDDGERLEPIELVLRTVAAPTVVRFRPQDSTRDVSRDAALSVRFSEPMDRGSARRAFRVKVDGTAVDGRIRFAEEDTVLVFTPASRLPYGSRVVMTVAEAATSAAGAPLGDQATGTFRTAPKPPPKPKRTPRATSPSTPKPPSGGGSAGSGSWYAVETYYLRLMNCTRTGGWVTSSGSCKSPGGRNVAALKLSSGISSKVARPYAKLLATRNACSHFIGGNPGDRLRRAGYTSYRWAENIGCRSGDPKKAVLGSHLYFQSEKSYNGGHYVNMMNAKYDRAGIGVWVASGRVRLVVNFYHP